MLHTYDFLVCVGGRQVEKMFGGKFKKKRYNPFRNVGILYFSIRKRKFVIHTEINSFFEKKTNSTNLHMEQNFEKKIMVQLMSNVDLTKT